jgi:hypothetical protein
MSQSVDITTSLRELMQLTVTLLATGPADALDADDAIHTEDGYGGRVEPGVELFRFTYNERVKQERWDVVVTTEQVTMIAAGELDQLPRLKKRPPWEVKIASGVFVESEAEAVAKQQELEALLRRAGGGDAMAALLASDDEDEEADDDTLDDAAQFLKLLIDAGALELGDDIELDKLARALVPVIAARGRSHERAMRLSETLLDHPGVEELHASDEELAKLLDKW